MAWDHKQSAPVRALGWFGKPTDQPPLYAFPAGLAAAGVIRREPKILRTAAGISAAHWIGVRGKNIVKRAVDRTRPQMLMEKGRYELGSGQRNEKKFNSFPSGHATGAVAVARALVRDYRFAVLPAYAAAAAAAVARIAECNHVVSDTAAGALIGLAAKTLVSGVIGKA